MWGITRARVHRVVASGRLPESVVSMAGNRWMLSLPFVEKVEERIKELDGRYKVDQAVREIAEEMMEETRG